MRHQGLIPWDDDADLYIERNKTAWRVMMTKVWPYMRNKGWHKIPGNKYTWGVPFSFYGREGVHKSPVHCAMFFWCRGKHGQLYFRNCKERTGKHAPFPEAARKKHLSKWKMTMHTTTSVAFPRQKMPWHRTWIWAAADLEGYFNAIISPFAMEGKITRGDRYEKMMAYAVIMGSGHHRNTEWARKVMKTKVTNIRYLKNYDPTDFEHTLPFPSFNKHGKFLHWGKTADKKAAVEVVTSTKKEEISEG